MGGGERERRARSNQGDPIFRCGGGGRFEVVGGWGTGEGERGSVIHFVYASFLETYFK